MARFWGTTGILLVFAALFAAFQTGYGRTDPEDQYRAILASRFDVSASPFREFARADPVSALQSRGRAEAVAIFDGPGLHESLSFTVYQTDEEARAAKRAVEIAYTDRDTFQDINAFQPDEFCVRLPRHRLDCFRAIDNLFLHTSVVPPPDEWGETIAFKTEFEPLYLLRTGYKQWLGNFRFGESGRR